MIAHLRGTLLDRGADTVVIEAGGVGYLVMPTAAGFRSLPALGSETRMHIYTHATQDGPYQLFGFPDLQERQLFETLISVQGVGPKVAVGILSSIAPADLVRAITGGDIRRLTEMKGVGRKIAERLCVELREKIAAVYAAAWGDGTAPAPAAPATGGPPGGVLGDVYGALVALGYKPAEFAGVLEKLDATRAVPDLVKDALAALRKR